MTNMYMYITIFCESSFWCFSASKPVKVASFLYIEKVKHFVNSVISFHQATWSNKQQAGNILGKDVQIQ